MTSAADCSTERVSSQVIVRHLNVAVEKGHGYAWPKWSGLCFMLIYMLTFPQ